LRISAGKNGALAARPGDRVLLGDLPTEHNLDNGSFAGIPSKPPDPAATFAAEAKYTRAIGDRTTDPILKQKWLRIEASYRALADGSLSVKDLGIKDPS
jgi:hypothetical protein